MLYKRKRSSFWQCEVTIDGVTLRQSTGTEDRKFAKAFEQKLIANHWRRQKLDVEEHTIKEAIDKWLADAPRSERDTYIVQQIPKQHSLLTDVTQRELQEHLDTIRKDASAATANRHRNAIRALFNQAKEWGWLANVPAFPTFKTDQFEPHWITQDQFKTLLATLPSHLAPLARFNGNVAYVPASVTKAGATIPVILNETALEVLKAQEGKHPIYAFPDHRGHAPIKSVKTAWKAATARAGIPELRFHDLRHSWASWLLQAGTPLHVVQKLGGWKSHDMLLKVYGHFTTEHLAVHVQKLKL
jgi:integrase